MNKNIKRVLTLSLCVILALSVLTVCSFALDFDKTWTAGETFTLGEYPQTKVAESSETALLKEIATQKKEWLSFEYYVGNGKYGQSEANGFMKYIDFTTPAGVKYRAVTADFSRPNSILTAPLDDNRGSQQEINGYASNHVYFFKYEPIEWVVVNPQTGLCVTKNVLDSQAFNNQLFYNEPNNNYYADSASRYLANCYTVSSVCGFLKTSFDAVITSRADLEHINLTDVKNIADSDYQQLFDTFDAKGVRTFLPSKSEAEAIPGTFKAATASDYALCQGVFTPSTTDTHAKYMTRTATKTTNAICTVDSKGTTKYTSETSATSIGIRPAAFVNLKSIYCKHAHGKTLDAVKVTCTTPGLAQGRICTDCGMITVIQDEIPVPTAKCPKYTTYDIKLNIKVENPLYDASLHDYEEIVVPATCTEEGYIAMHCKLCGQTFIKDGTSMISKTGHKPVTYANPIPATCESYGWTEGTKCAVCNQILSFPARTPKAEHNWGDWETVKAFKDCTPLDASGHVTDQNSSEGIYERHCKDCGLGGNNEEKTDFYLKTWTYADGANVFVRENKDESGKVTAVNFVDTNQVGVKQDATGFYFIEAYDKVIKETVDGEEIVYTKQDTRRVDVTPVNTYLAQRRQALSDEDQRLLHLLLDKDFINPVIDLNEDVPDDKTQGVAKTYIVKPAHHFVHQVTPATCTDPGSERDYCTRCGFVDNAHDIPSFGGHHCTLIKVLQEPTTNMTGKGKIKCRDCGIVFDYTIPKLSESQQSVCTSHKDDNKDGVCDLCGVRVNADLTVGDQSTKGCDCMCHKTGIQRFIYRILNFFYQIMGINQTCECGQPHYDATKNPLAGILDSLG